ncbi:hypothetical protein D039_1024B, partial [Vibrio parahaemolyticus EKP-028]
ALSTYA